MTNVRYPIQDRLSLSNIEWNLGWMSRISRKSTRRKIFWPWGNPKSTTTLFRERFAKASMRDEGAHMLPAMLPQHGLIALQVGEIRSRRANIQWANLLLTSSRGWCEARHIKTSHKSSESNHLVVQKEMGITTTRMKRLKLLGIRTRFNTAKTIWTLSWPSLNTHCRLDPWRQTQHGHVIDVQHYRNSSKQIWIGTFPIPPRPALDPWFEIVNTLSIYCLEMNSAREIRYHDRNSPHSSANPKRLWQSESQTTFWCTSRNIIAMMPPW